MKDEPDSSQSQNVCPEIRPISQFKQEDPIDLEINLQDYESSERLTLSNKLIFQNQQEIDRIYQLSLAQQHFDQNFLQYLKYINSILAEFNLARLRAELTPFILHQIQQIIFNLEIYSAQYSQQLTRFTRLVQLKELFFKQFFHQLFPTLKQLINQLLKALKIQPLKKMRQKCHRVNKQNIYDSNKSKNYLEIEQLVDQQRQKADTLIFQTFGYQNNKTDALFLQFLKAFKNKNHPFHGCDIQKIFEEEFLQYCAQEKAQTDDWYELFQLIIKNKSRKQISHFANNIQKECLGCSRFYYENGYLNRKEHNISLVTFSSIHQFPTFQHQINHQIIKMMNKNGGIIFFDCEKHFFDIKIKGSVITEQQKLLYIQKINKIISFIYPRIKFQQNIVVSFVPVVENTKNQKSEQHQLFDSVNELHCEKSQITKKYLKGKYVCRIIIIPSVNNDIYFWHQQEAIKDSYHLNVKPFELMNSQIKLPFNKIRKLLKKKIIHQHASQFEKSKINSQKLLFNHICEQPQKGVIIQTNKHDIQDEAKIEMKDHFNNLSLLVVKSKYLQDIRNKLGILGIKGSIVQKYEKYRFKHFKHCALFYHQESFGAILSSLTFNKQFQYQGKKLLAVEITPFLKFHSRTQQNPFSSADYCNLLIWLKEEFPQEQLSIFQFNGRQSPKQYYLSTKCKEALVFLYYLLTHFGEKVVFKNPKGLNQMKEDEKAIRFKNMTSIFKLGNKQSLQTSLQDTSIEQPAQKRMFKYLEQADTSMSPFTHKNQINTIKTYGMFEILLTFEYQHFVCLFDL